MSTHRLASERYRRRQRLARSLDAEGRRLWRSLRGELSGWRISTLRLAVLLTAAQRAAASGADEYVNAVVGETEAAGAVAAGALAGVASDGRPLDTLLRQPEIATRVALSRGATQGRAFATGEAALSMILRTQVADAGRVADGIAIAARPRTGYVRMLVGTTCSRCAVLAGRFYRYNAGFLRHPGCDCLHVPAKGEAGAQSEGLISDPKEYFDSLPQSEQDRIFTNAGAEAIREGADPAQIVNARRGMTAAGTTTEGATRRGFARTRLRGEPRLMPERIYQLADSRDEAVSLLRRHRYII